MVFENVEAEDKVGEVGVMHVPICFGHQPSVGGEVGEVAVFRHVATNAFINGAIFFPSSILTNPQPENHPPSESSPIPKSSGLKRLVGYNLKCLDPIDNHCHALHLAMMHFASATGPTWLRDMEKRFDVDGYRRNKMKWINEAIGRIKALDQTQAFKNVSRAPPKPILPLPPPSKYCQKTRPMIPTPYRYLLIVRRGAAYNRRKRSRDLEGGIEDQTGKIGEPVKATDVRKEKGGEKEMERDKQRDSRKKGEGEGKGKETQKRREGEGEAGR
ncbi:hypothetical protein BC829DRAFT_420126 [Chytridium lagenaria]|nr:hypothetical protein BC829DRAFT_420126 [Chytridium lagenaria]